MTPVSPRAVKSVTREHHDITMHIKVTFSKIASDHHNNKEPAGVPSSQAVTSRNHFKSRRTAAKNSYQTPVPPPPGGDKKQTPKMSPVFFVFHLFTFFAPAHQVRICVRASLRQKIGTRGLDVEVVVEVARFAARLSQLSPQQPPSRDRNNGKGKADNSHPPHPTPGASGQNMSGVLAPCR